MNIKGDLNSNIISLSELANDARQNALRVFMPIQRGYVWKETFIDMLCIEFLKTIEDHEFKSFLMTILTSSKRNLLFDGQQRITSSLILIRVLVYIYETSLNKTYDQIPGAEVGKIYKDINRFNIGINSAEEFFKIFEYSGNEEADTLNLMFRNELSNESLDKLFSTNKISNDSRYQMCALRFYKFIQEVETSVKEYRWSDLMSRICFNKLTMDVPQGREKEYMDKFCIINTMHEPVSSFIIMKAFLGYDNFYSVIKSDNRGNYDYMESGEDNSDLKENIFVKHCIQSFFLMYGEKGGKMTNDICFSPKNFDELTLFICMTNDISSRENGKELLYDIAVKLGKFYYEVVCTDSNKYIALIRNIGKLSSLMSSLFVVYYKYYNTDREMFDKCVEYIYLGTLLPLIDGQERNHTEFSIRNFVYEVVRNNTPRLQNKDISISSIMATCKSIDALMRKNVTKSKHILRYLENGIRVRLGYYNSVVDTFPCLEEGKKCNLDHFIPVGEEREEVSNKNILGNYFLLENSGNTSKNDLTTMDKIVPVYSRSTYVTTRLFSMGRDSVNSGRYVAFIGLLKDINKAKCFDCNMVDDFNSLLITEDSMTIEYITKRSDFISRLFSYMFVSEYDNIVRYFKPTDNDVEIAESPAMEFSESH